MFISNSMIWPLSYEECQQFLFKMVRQETLTWAHPGSVRSSWLGPAPGISPSKPRRPHKFAEAVPGLVGSCLDVSYESPLWLKISCLVRGSSWLWPKGFRMRGAKLTKSFCILASIRLTNSCVFANHLSHAPNCAPDPLYFALNKPAAMPSWRINFGCP